MKTTFLILSLWLTAAFGLWAQPAPMSSSDISNRTEMLRQMLRRSYHGTNVPAPGAGLPHAINPAAATTETETPAAVQSSPAIPGLPVAPTAIPSPGVTSPVNNVLPAVNAAVSSPKPPTEDPSMDEMIPPGMIDFPGTDLNQVLNIYARLVNRTILRPANLSAPPIVLKTQTPLTKREAIEAFNALLGMNGIAIINIGDKFAKAVPSTQAGGEGGAWNELPPDALPEMGQYVTHVMQLQYVKPSAVVPVLAPFQKMPNAAIAIDDSQILVLRDYTENVKRMLEMVKQVDVAVPAEIISEVIPIKYALAGDIASALNSVSSGTSVTTTGSSGGSATGLSTSSGGRSGSLLNGGRTTTTYGGVGAQANSRFGGAGNANPNVGGGQGDTFSSRIRQIINRAASPGGAGNGEFQILGQTKIIADERTNSLLVFATRADMDTIKSIVGKLDVVLAQVLIEAIIVDVTLGKDKSLGISGAQEPQKLNTDLTGAGGMVNGNSFFNFLNASSNAFSAFTGSLPSGFSYFGRVDQGWDFTLTALASDSRVNILSRPRIQTSHAVPATLFIGQTIPYINGTTTDINGGNRSTYEQRDVGINLSVLPLINPEGLVVMDIQEDIEQLGNNVIIDGNPIPQTVRRSASAKVAVRDGDTIILGGFISTTKSKSKSGVPFLSDIPLLGYLFRQTTDHNERDELAVLMHPKVLPTPEVAAIAADEDQRQMPGVRRAEKEIRAAEKAAVQAEQRREFQENSEVRPR